MKPERSNDRKIAANVKEGLDDRSVYFTLVSTTARLRWMHGTARKRHRTDRVENHQSMSRRDGAAIKAEPAASFSASVTPADKKGFPPSLSYLIPDRVCVRTSFRISRNTRRSNQRRTGSPGKRRRSVITPAASISSRDSFTRVSRIGQNRASRGNKREPSKILSRPSLLIRWQIQPLNHGIQIQFSSFADESVMSVQKDMLPRHGREPSETFPAPCITIGFIFLQQP